MLSWFSKISILTISPSFRATVSGMSWGDRALCFQSLILLASAIYAWRAIREAKTARDLQAARELFNELGSDPVREARRVVLETIGDGASIDALTDEQIQDAKRVAVALDRVGYMVSQKLVPDHPFFVWQRDEIEKLWIKLKPIVTHVRGDASGRPHYCEHFELLATRWFLEMKSKYQHIPVGATPNLRNRLRFNFQAWRRRRLTEKTQR